MQFAWWLCHPKPSSNSEDVKHETALMLLQVKAETETFGSDPKAEGVSPERKSMNSVAVVTNTNKPLMPTSPYRARKLLNSGKAKIVKHRPFTILLVNRSDGDIQEIEYKSDTGYHYPDGGIPLNEKVEHIYPDYSIYYDLLPKVKYTAYGFLTRGCPRNCNFCIVSGKEGRCSHKVADLSEFWNGQREIVLLDPNMFACKDWRELCQQLIASKARRSTCLNSN